MARKRNSSNNLGPMKPAKLRPEQPIKRANMITAGSRGNAAPRSPAASVSTAQRQAILNDLESPSYGESRVIRPITSKTVTQKGRVSGNVKRTGPEVVSTPSASAQISAFKKRPSFQVTPLSQHEKMSSLQIARGQVALEKKDGRKKEARIENETCKPRPEPVRTGAGGGRRSFVPWKAREDLKCR